jgi:hypothetical protein
MFLFRWAKWTTAFTGSSFPVWQFEFPSRLIFQPVNWAQCCTTFLLKKTVEYRPASDRSSLPIERAFFTQLSPCCDNSDDVFGIMVFDELVKKFELKVRARGWIILINQRGGVRGCLICGSRIARTFLIYPTDRCFVFTVSMTVIVSTITVGWRRSCWDSAFTTPDWSWFLTPTRHSLVNCCLFSVYTVYAITFDGSCLTHSMTTATLIIYI